MNQEKFLNDLQSFILNHPYYQAQEGTQETLENQDKVTYDISDPDGNYEAIAISINLIS